jgi:hypothetical protein
VELFGESHARLLLVAHTISAAALVASTTHLVVWMRGWPRGNYLRVAAVRRFALIAASLYVLTFLLGNLLYPTYKVRVKVEYLQEGPAVVAAHAARARGAAETRHRYDQLQAVRRGDPEPPALDAPTEGELAEQSALLPRTANKVARWFDSKEHWVALGLPLSLACALLLQVWRPKEDGGNLGWIVFSLALAAAAVVWFAAIVGIVTVSYRAVGG